ncbi:MAG: PilN domain-containing protein [Acidobacteria bacterium]|nr:PilN domain-containing protein [Acidobacteriota bacterium]MBI3654890.1 PilN domain-containing protein [Acidobacteriota bacterium]
MIRINLIRDRTVALKRPTIEPKFTRLGGLMFVIVFLNLAGLGWWYRSLILERAARLSQQEKLDSEATRLKTIYDKVKDHEKQKKQLDERIDIIEKLKESQVGPVELLNKVKASVPEQMWLTSLAQTADAISIDGNFLREEVLPMFIKNLELTRYFTNVDLNFYEKEREGDRHRFSLRCQVANKK